MFPTGLRRLMALVERIPAEGLMLVNLGIVREAERL